MITDDQLTALAREYGEYVANSLDYDVCADPELRHRLVVKGHSESAQLVLEWLLRRFCLVEKSKFQELEIVRRAKEHGAVWLNRWEAEYLFPEIAKEVEG